MTKIRQQLSSQALPICRYFLGCKQNNRVSLFQQQSFGQLKHEYLHGTYTHSHDDNPCAHHSNGLQFKRLRSSWRDVTFPADTSRLFDTYVTSDDDISCAAAVDAVVIVGLVIVVFICVVIVAACVFCCSSCCSCSYEAKVFSISLCQKRRYASWCV